MIFRGNRPTLELEFDTAMMFVRLSLVALLAVAASAQTDPSGDALFAAIRRGAVGEADRLLTRGVSPNATDADGTPALMAATLFANANMVDVLLKHGADPNRPGPGGATALMWAVPDVEKVRRLLARLLDGERAFGQRPDRAARGRFIPGRFDPCGCSSSGGPIFARRTR